METTPRKKRILVIDDDDSVRETLQDALESPEIIIESSKSGDDGLKLLLQNKPDLIISDYNMPGLDGMELLNTLRERLIEVPVIWISGRADQSFFREAWRLGVFDYFEKPFSVQKLKEQALSALYNPHVIDPTQRKSFLTEKYVKIMLEVPQDSHEKLLEISKQRSISITTYINQLLARELFNPK